MDRSASRIIRKGFEICPAHPGEEAEPGHVHCLKCKRYFKIRVRGLDYEDHEFRMSIVRSPAMAQNKRAVNAVSLELGLPKLPLHETADEMMARLAILSELTKTNEEAMVIMSEMNGWPDAVVSEVEYKAADGLAPGQLARYYVEGRRFKIRCFGSWDNLEQIGDVRLFPLQSYEHFILSLYSDWA